MNEPQIGNVGIVTTMDESLCEVTGIRDGLLYCMPMQGARITRVCLPWHFWVLLDSF